MGARVYLAGRFEARGRLRECAARLEKIAPGWVVISSWLNEPPEMPYESGDEKYLKECAARALYEVTAADRFILDTADEPSRGGREVEFGLALGYGTKNIVVGPLRNVFHRLADWHFDSWGELLEYFERSKERHG